MVASNMPALDLSHFVNFEQVKILVVILLTLNSSKISMVILLTLDRSKLLMFILLTLNNNNRFISFFGYYLFILYKEKSKTFL